VRLLLDAHTLIWAVEDPSRIGRKAFEFLRDRENELLLSVGTIWEIAIKTGSGKLALSLPFRAWMEQGIRDLEAKLLPITLEHADIQASLPQHHKDPFDRLLVAQAQVEGAQVVSADKILDQYGIERLW
jgi:PIN domain nuclease of toxin-antitoxin system